MFWQAGRDQELDRIRADESLGAQPVALSGFMSADNFELRVGRVLTMDYGVGENRLNPVEFQFAQAHNSAHNAREFTLLTMHVNLSALWRTSTTYL